MGWLDVVALIGGAVPGVGPLFGPVVSGLAGALSDARHITQRPTGPASNDPVDVALWEIDQLHTEINDMLNRHEEESWVL